MSQLQNPSNHYWSSYITSLNHKSLSPLTSNPDVATTSSYVERSLLSNIEAQLTQVNYISVYNWCEVKAKMWILNLGKPVNIPVLSQEMAIELGANLLGETVIFVIGAGLLIVEYNRQSKKEAVKEAKKAEEMEHITSTIRDLYFTVQQQQTQLREMERLVHSINGKKPVPSPSSTNKPTKQPPQPPSAGPKLVNAQNIIGENNNASHTPYPNKGLILQSLNYIQMDVFSSLFPEECREIVLSAKEKSQIPPKREPALLSETLYNIENSFRSLF